MKQKRTEKRGRGKPSSGRVRVLIMLDPQLDSYAKKLGAGNRSDGINRALAEHRNRNTGV